MSKPQEDLNHERYIKETFVFFDQLAKICQDSQDGKKFLAELLTPSEIRMIKKRWYIARLLHSGMDVRSVAGEAEVSTTTVVRVSQTLKKDGSIFKQLLNSLTSKTTEEPDTTLPEIDAAPDQESSNPSHRYSFGYDE